MRKEEPEEAKGEGDAPTPVLDLTIQSYTGTDTTELAPTPDVRFGENSVLNLLPGDMWLHLFNFLTLLDLMHIARTCKSARAIVNDYPILKSWIKYGWSKSLRRPTPIDDTIANATIAYSKLKPIERQIVTAKIKGDEQEITTLSGSENKTDKVFIRERLLIIAVADGKIEPLKEYELQLEEAFGACLVRQATQLKQQAFLDYFYQELFLSEYPDYRNNDHYKDSDERTLAHWASALGQVEILKVLLTEDLTFFLNAKNQFGDTALIIAAVWGHTDCLSLLLARGADPDRENKLGDTALIKAAGNGRTDCVRILLENGADLNISDNDGDTALIRAAWYGCTDCVELLLARGGKTDIKNKPGYTALIWAARNGDTTCVQLLLDKDADPDIANNAGNTALMVAASWDHTDCVRLLLEKGADPNIKNNDGNTALCVCLLYIFVFLKKEKKSSYSHRLFSYFSTSELKKAKGADPILFTHYIKEILRKPETLPWMTGTQRARLLSDPTVYLLDDIETRYVALIYHMNNTSNNNNNTKSSKIVEEILKDIDKVKGHNNEYAKRIETILSIDTAYTSASIASPA